MTECYYQLCDRASEPGARDSLPRKPPLGTKGSLRHLPPLSCYLRGPLSTNLDRLNPCRDSLLRSPILFCLPLGVQRVPDPAQADAEGKGAEDHEGEHR